MYGNEDQLLFTDIDSLAYKIQTEDFYNDIANDIQARFDTSKHPENHPFGIEAGLNKYCLTCSKSQKAPQTVKRIVEFVTIYEQNLIGCSKVVSMKMCRASFRNEFLYCQTHITLSALLNLVCNLLNFDIFVFISKTTPESWTAQRQSHRVIISWPNILALCLAYPCLTIQKPFRCNSKLSSSLFHKQVDAWNYLPCALKSLTSFTLFKSAIEEINVSSFLKGDSFEQS